MTQFCALNREAIRVKIVKFNPKRAITDLPEVYSYKGWIKRWQLFDSCDMTLFADLQHLCTFNKVAPLIYHFLPNVWKASYIISASIFVDVLY